MQQEHGRLVVREWGSDRGEECSVTQQEKGGAVSVR